jgi:hypothetical protein
MRRLFYLFFASVAVVGLLTAISIAIYTEGWRELKTAYPLGLLSAQALGGLLIAVAGSIGLLYRAVEGGAPAQLIGMAMVVFAGSIVAGASWENCIGLGALGIAAAVVAWKGQSS